MRCIAQPGPGSEHANPWRGKKAHLRCQLSGLLASIVEILRELRIEKQDGFTGGHAVLRSAEAEHIDPDAPCHVGGAASKTGASVGKARAVHVEAQTEFPAAGRNGPQ